MKRTVKRLILTAVAIAFPAMALAAQPEVIVEKIPGTDVQFELVKLPAGKIEMGKRGDNEPAVVEIKPIAISKYEVTWDAFGVYAFALDLTQEEKAKGVDAESRPSKPYGPPDRGFGTTDPSGSKWPAISESSKAAEQYCVWLSKKTGKKYRLPTEAEWEYACRAGGPEVNPTKEELDKIAWVFENAEETPHPVGKKAPNAWGLYDMLGNVGEWAKGADGAYVQKGGSWYDPAKAATSGGRLPYDPMWQMTDPQDPKSKWWYSDGWHIGFRVVRED